MDMDGMADMDGMYDMRMKNMHTGHAMIF